MSGNYRVEIASTGRAQCQNAACKEKGDKIPKGELRQGVSIIFNEHTSMKWRHWGCVTPTVLHNWKEKSDGDMEMVDGYEELPEALQEKVKRALEQEHVDDEDWNGDAELNRYNPAARNQGMYKKTPKAKKGDKDDDNDTSKAKQTTKKRRRKAADEDDEDEEKPAPKKSRGKKAKGDDTNDEPAPAAPAKKARGKNAKVKEADEAKDDPVPAVKKGRGKKAKSTDPDPVAAADSDDEPIRLVKPTAKKGRGTKSSATTDELPAEEPKSKTKSQKRKAKPQKKAAAESSEQDSD